jgi:hypothetical protein
MLVFHQHFTYVSSIEQFQTLIEGVQFYTDTLPSSPKPTSSLLDFCLLDFFPSFNILNKLLTKYLQDVT